MVTIYISISLMVLAFVVTTMVYPHVLTFARKHNVVDNPNARKLQRVPVPVMGGTTVFIGLLVSVLAEYSIAPEHRLIPIMLLLFVMYLLGAWDDVKDVSAGFRFLIEFLVVWLIILLLDVEINDFHGLWGLDEVPDTVSVPLSLFAGVGIMNAVNMIDGVDGYCSTYGIMACAMFAWIFHYSGDMIMFTLALIGIGALIPFFFHNVFGKTSKMFLGDGGSLMLGTLLTMFLFSTLYSDSRCAYFDNIGLNLPALSLAILAVPVFDTLKVMLFRIVNGHSPFHPDKTHLHHLFIEMNFSHLATSGLIVFTNVLLIGILLLSWYFGLGNDAQVYLVIGMAMAYIWGFYFFMEWHHKQNDGEGSELFQRWCLRGRKTKITSGTIWRFIRRIVDSRFLAGKSAAADQKTDDSVGQRIDPRIT